MTTLEFKKYKLIFALLAMPLPCYAINSTNEYHFEGGSSYTRENNASLDTNSWQANLKYYWNPVVYTQNYPNKEAQFINRLGTLGVIYTESEGNNSSVDIFSNGVGVSARYAAKDFNHTFELGYSWTNRELNRPPRFFLGDSSTELDIHAVNFAYNYYLLENLTIGAGLEVGFLDDDVTNDNSFAYTLSTKYLLTIAEQQWLTLTADYAYADMNENTFFFDSLHYLEASAEYYFTPKTSLKLGANVSYFDYGSFKENVNLEWTHYIVDQFTVNAAFEYQFKDRADSQVFNVGMSYRF